MSGLVQHAVLAPHGFSHLLAKSLHLMSHLDEFPQGGRVGGDKAALEGSRGSRYGWREA